MTTLENPLYTSPEPLAEYEYIPPHPTQHVYGESDSPTDPTQLYSARWRNLRTFGGTGDITEGRTWSRKYSFVSHPIYEDFENTKQINHKNDVLEYHGTAIRQTRKTRYADMARGRSRLPARYASKSDRGTNYNTHNFIHVDSDGVFLNDLEVPGLGIGPKVGPFPPIVPIVPLISADMTVQFPQQVEPVQNGIIMPLPIPVSQPDPPAYGTTPKSSILLAATANDPEVVDAVTQRYVFKLTGDKSVATREHDDDVQQLIMDTSEVGQQFDEKTTLFIDENMEYYVLRQDTGHPTWDSPKWVRHYLTTDFANSYFGRGQSGPIIPGIDLTVSKWAETDDGFILIDLVGTMQFKYGYSTGTDNFHVTY